MSDTTTTVTTEELNQIESRTDWDRVREQSDADIEAAVQSDPDTMLLDANWFEAARLVVPTAEK
jgi:hypothetical protein